MDSSIDQKKVQQFGQLEFIAKQVVEGFITGLHKSPFHGFSVEFSEHRQYNSGESIKHIDWKLFARTEKLFVKRYEEETNLRCQLVIDNSSSMYYPIRDSITPENPNKIIFSIYCAAALMYLFRLQRDAVGLSVFSDTVEVQTAARSGPVHHKIIYYELEKMLHAYVEGSNKKTFAVDALHRIAENVHKRSLVILFSDMMESKENTNELFNAMQHLKHNKHEVILFHVVDKKKEFDFDFDNRPYKFIDMETGDELKINPNEIRHLYTKAITKYKEELKLKCGQYRIDFVESDIAEGFNHVLQSYLIKRMKLY